jgi:hypothetical protein
MKALLLRVLASMVVAISPTLAFAQTSTSPPGNSGGVGDTNAIVVPLQIGGDVTLMRNGPFGAAVAGVNVTGYFGASGTAGHPPAPPIPPGPPTVPIVDFQTLEAQLIQTRAAHCLTIADAAPCDNPTIPPGAFNVVSTDVSIAWLVDRAVQAAWKDIPLPGIVMAANPPEGLAQMASWFWVDRNTYGGQAFSEPVHMPVPWTLDYDTLVHHHDTLSAPCPGDPSQTCTTSRDWDETVHTHQDHMDMVDVTVTLSPAQYAWDFGDDDAGPWRQTSHASFPDNAGIGTPYIDPYHASTVTHKYSESSLKDFAAGGFLVRLTATWSASAHVQASRDGAVVQSETRTLQPRVGVYQQRYQVRESWPVSISVSRDMSATGVAP